MFGRNKGRVRSGHALDFFNSSRVLLQPETLPSKLLHHVVSLLLRISHGSNLNPVWPHVRNWLPRQTVCKQQKEYNPALAVSSNYPLCFAVGVLLISLSFRGRQQRIRGNQDLFTVFWVCCADSFTLFLSTGIFSESEENAEIYLSISKKNRPAVRYLSFCMHLILLVLL